MIRVQLHEILNQRDVLHPAVSIYLTQESRKGPQRQNLKLRRLCRQARQLIRRDKGKSLADQVVSPIEAQIEYLSNKYPRGGLGIFSTANEQFYVLIPWSGPELSVVSSSFHTKPLVKWSQDPRRFFLLSASRNAVNLSISSPSGLFHIHREELKATPREEGSPGRRSRSAQAHNAEQKIVREIRKKLNHFQNHLTGNMFPLLVCGRPAFARPILERINYPYTILESLDVNPLSVSGEALRKRATEFLVEKQKMSHRDLLLEISNSRPVYSLQEIAKASVQGRIDTLVVAEDQQVWGQLNRVTGRLRVFDRQRNSRDDDLLDDISEEVLRYRGEVRVLPKKEIPGKSLACAVLRW